MKKLSIIYWLLAILLPEIMCAVVAYNYRHMRTALEHSGYSAPASTAFLLVIPYAVGIAACVILAIFFRRKAQSDPCRQSASGKTAQL